MRAVSGNFLQRILAGKQNLCYLSFCWPVDLAAGWPTVKGAWTGTATATAVAIQPKARAMRRGDFFIWIRRKPLKRPESAKGIQGKTRTFPWIHLDFLAFICMEVAFRL
jgi:hypothetical protein